MTTQWLCCDLIRQRSLITSVPSGLRTFGNRSSVGVVAMPQARIPRRQKKRTVLGSQPGNGATLENLRKSHEISPSMSGALDSESEKRGGGSSVLQYDARDFIWFYAVLCGLSRFDSKSGEGRGRKCASSLWRLRLGRRGVYPWGKLAVTSKQPCKHWGFSIDIRNMYRYTKVTNRRTDPPSSTAFAKSATAVKKALWRTGQRRR